PPWPAPGGAPSDQPSSARYSWTDRTALDPSPTAAATRFIEPERTSPTANTPGPDVSNGNTSRPGKSGPAATSSGNERSVRMNPRVSVITASFSHEVHGWAPM